MLELFDRAFDFPSSRVSFDHLFSGHGQIGGEDGKESLGFLIMDKNNFNRSLKTATYASKFRVHTFTALAVDKKEASIS